MGNATFTRTYGYGKTKEQALENFKHILQYTYGEDAVDFFKVAEYSDTATPFIVAKMIFENVKYRISVQEKNKIWTTFVVAE